jgi:hypothetical protein
LDKTSAKLRFGPRIGKFMDVGLQRPETPDAVKAEFRPRLQVNTDSASSPLDTIVLRFEAFLRQDLPAGIRGAIPGDTVISPEYVIRRVIIQYFMVDDSIAVVEPTVDNSGLTQGVLIRRQLIPKANNGAIVGTCLYIFFCALYSVTLNGD